MNEAGRKMGYIASPWKHPLNLDVCRAPQMYQASNRFKRGRRRVWLGLGLCGSVLAISGYIFFPESSVWEYLWKR